MKKITKLAAIIALSLAAAGCGVGTKIDWAKARTVKPGMTTKQVTDIMGQPYSVVSKPDGVRTYVWVYASALSGSQSASMSFKDGIVTNVPDIPDSFN